MQYKIVAIEKTPPPEGAKGEVWHRYVIENERSTITGCRSGSKRHVTQYANKFVKELNNRCTTTSWSSWSTRIKQ